MYSLLQSIYSTVITKVLFVFIYMKVSVKKTASALMEKDYLIEEDLTNCTQDSNTLKSLSM